MNKNYKVEVKPSFWHVKLSNGCYSGYTEKHLFFHSNSPEETWHYLCKLKASHPLDTWHKYLGLIWGKEKWLHPKTKIENINWDSDYGNVWKVSIKPLKVYEFQKLI